MIVEAIIVNIKAHGINERWSNTLKSHISRVIALEAFLLGDSFPYKLLESISLYENIWTIIDSTVRKFELRVANMVSKFALYVLMVVSANCQFIIPI